MREADFEKHLAFFVPLLRYYGEDISALDELYFGDCTVAVWVAYRGACRDGSAVSSSFPGAARRGEGMCGP
jgi:hypothetical protein